MIEAALIEQCADPILPPAIVEAFLERAGSPDPLAITVRAGHRVVAIPASKTPEEAVGLARRYVGLAHVRVGLTQLPAGLGIHEPADLPVEIFDACANLNRGTGLFGRIYRVVVQAHRAATDEALDDAIDAWRTGSFAGASVSARKKTGPTRMEKVRTATRAQVRVEMFQPQATRSIAHPTPMRQVSESISQGSAGTEHSANQINLTHCVRTGLRIGAQ